MATRVLVTRAADEAGPLCDRLRAIGCAPVEVPLVAIVPCAWAVPVGIFDWLVLTSAAAVDAVAGRPLRARRTAAVGPATAARARDRGLKVDLVPLRATGADLAAALGDLRGRTVLYPRAEVATPGTTEALRGAGAELTEIVAYRNAVPPDAAERLTRALPVDFVTLLSGSAARRLADALTRAGKTLGKARIVAIGPSTAAAARAAGLEVHAVAATHTVEAVAEAVQQLRDRR